MNTGVFAQVMSQCDQPELHTYLGHTLEAEALEAMIVLDISKDGLWLYRTHTPVIKPFFAGKTLLRSCSILIRLVINLDYAVALRAVLTSDFMTAEPARLPWDVLTKAASRIVNEVKGVNRVLYDCTGKPPATIEFE